ncbi:MAG: dUTP diphosphatase [Clostridia bacterium]|nr:dUTP diphosphatase [Clostridia bacterium]
MRLNIKRLFEKAVLPEYATDGSAGMDLRALDACRIAPGGTGLVRTGIAAEIPEGYVGLVCARSGLASKKGLAPANKVGVIDSDYRGEIMVALHNHSGSEGEIAEGERIAQLLIMPVARCEVTEVAELSDTLRGEGGFGSTGQK